MEYLSTVDDVFWLEGRGCVITPGIPENSKWRIKVGDALHLIRPDGSTLPSKVAGIEMISVSSPRRRPTPLLLPPEVRREEVPIGTKVFVVLSS
jgi:hypothetical protein